MPSNTAAVLVSKQANPLEVRSAPYPSPGAHELVIRVRAAAVNPVDWLIQDHAPFPMQYPIVLGEDAAGEVVDVGEGVTAFAKGDRVLGHAMALGTGKAAYGSFQEYLVLHDDVTAKIPSGLSFEQASVVPLGFSTAACGLYLEDHLALRLPQVGAETTSSPAQEVVIVWGGSTSVGSNAVQLAAASGYEVVATASPANFDYVKSLGASVVIDYNSGDLVQQLNDATRGKAIHGALDCITKHGSVEAIAEVLAQSQSSGTKKTIATVLPPPDKLADGVKAAGVMATKLREDGKLTRALYGEFLPESLERGSFKAVPEAMVVGHGPENVQKGLDVQRKGVSAKKVVVTF